MGGLQRQDPVHLRDDVIGTLALTGFPLTAGYFSKDAIIEAAYAAHNRWRRYAFVLTVIAAALTAFYSWRLIFMTFHGAPHDRAALRARAREPADDADPARRAGGGLDARRLAVQRAVHRRTASRSSSASR